MFEFFFCRTTKPCHTGKRWFRCSITCSEHQNFTQDSLLAKRIKPGPPPTFHSQGTSTRFRIKHRVDFSGSFFHTLQPKSVLFHQNLQRVFGECIMVDFWFFDLFTLKKKNLDRKYYPWILPSSWEDSRRTKKICPKLIIFAVCFKLCFQETPRNSPKQWHCE